MTGGPVSWTEQPKHQFTCTRQTFDGRISMIVWVSYILLGCNFCPADLWHLAKRNLLPGACHEPYFSVVWSEEPGT